MSTPLLATERSSFLLTLAIIATFFATMLPQAIGEQLFNLEPVQVLWARGILLAILFLFAIVYRPARLLRGYLSLLLAILLANEALRPFIANSAFWQGLFPAQAGVSFSFIHELGAQILRLLPSLAAWIMLVVMGFKRTDYFMTVGDMDAPAGPVRWLGIKPTDRWKKTGLSFLFMIAVITLIIMLMANRPSGSDLARLAPLFPAILFFAALNAFNENFYTRAGLFPVLLPVFGRSNTLLLSTLFFSLGHLEFTQMGPTAFLFAALLGWILGKSMLETRGFAWAWLIQLPNDVLAFAFILMAM